MSKESIASIKAKLKENPTNDQLLIWAEDERKGVQQALKSYYRQQEKKEALKASFLERSGFERALYEEGYQWIAGVDEVGRGPLAGPVVTAAVILNKDCQLYELNDSKKLSAKKREALYEQIMDQAVAVSIGICSAEEIDQYNIYEATKIAMKSAINQLAVQPDYVLLDAMQLDISQPQKKLIHGDARSISIAAASIIAKVTRDRMMESYSKQYPYYDFENNMGYGTPKHLDGLKKHGICSIHRKSFEPIKSQYL